MTRLQRRLTRRTVTTGLAVFDVARLGCQRGAIGSPFSIAKHQSGSPYVGPRAQYKTASREQAGTLA